MNKKDKQIQKKVLSEDTTKYGEFVSTFHHWIIPEEQKERAKELENITDKDK